MVFISAEKYKSSQVSISCQFISECEEVHICKMWFKTFLVLFCVAQFSVAKKTVCVFHHTGVILRTYTCTLVNQNIQNEVQMENVVGQHEPGFSDSDVTALRQTGSTIAIFPSVIIDRFVNLASVILNNVGMTTFGQPITNCANLQTITLGNGLITSIPPGIFRNCINLVQLSLSNQPINTIDTDAFDGLNRMQFMWMSGANLPTLDPQVFAPMTQLIYLDLINNQITTISTQFPRFSQLLILDLSNNNITTWNPVHLEANPQLAQLLLGRNEIATLSADSFANLPQLTYLSVGDSLTELPVFENLARLDSLYIERCPLTHVSAATFQNMVSLRQLGLQGNQIVTFDFGAQTPPILQGLTFLNLAFNQITNVPDHSLGTLTVLNRLYLNHNLITRLSENSLRPVINRIGTLDLRYNQIEVIERGLLDNVTSLTIRMSGCHTGNVILGPNLQSNSQAFLENCLSFGMSLKVNIFVLFSTLGVAVLGKKL